MLHRSASRRRSAGRGAANVGNFSTQFGPRRCARYEITDHAAGTPADIGSCISRVDDGGPIVLESISIQVNPAQNLMSTMYAYNGEDGDYPHGEAAVHSGLYDPSRAVRRGSRPVYDVGTPRAFT